MFAVWLYQYRMEVSQTGRMILKIASVELDSFRFVKAAFTSSRHPWFEHLSAAAASSLVQTSDNMPRTSL